MQKNTEINTEISERIMKLINFLGVNKNEFAKKLGYSRSQTVYDITNGKSKPSYDFFSRLLNSEYSELFNIKWLFTGKGNIENNIYKEPTNNGVDVSESFIQYDSNTKFTEIIDIQKIAISALKNTIKIQEKYISRLEKTLKQLESDN